MFLDTHDRRAAQRRSRKSFSTPTRRMAILLAFLWLGGVLHVVAQAEPQFRIDDPIQSDPDSLEFDKPTVWRTQQIYDIYENLFPGRGEEAQPRAVNTNTLGEVPDSSWFNNRIGARSVGIDEIVTGPNLTGGPAPGPFTVIGRPTGGVTPKFLIEDTAGQRFILKFDPMDYPELASSADMICSKLFWAAGYNVAEGYITTLTKDRLLIGEGAIFENELGEEALIIQEDIDAWMENAPRDSGGLYRAQASKFVSGEQIGEFRFYGTRSDDPNDIFPHEHRRELRGYRVLAAWLNHDDSRATNTYDAFVGEGDRGFIEHYLLDFGSCLGSASIGANLPSGGHEYFIEKGPILKSMLTLGLWSRPWLHADFPDYPAVGNIEAEYFVPEKWKAEYPNAAYDHMDAADAFWAARIVAEFTDEIVRAVVQAGQISDPDAEAYLVDVLFQRRDKVLATWLTLTNPLDGFEVSGSGAASPSVIWDNAAIRAGVAASGASYRVQWYSFDNDAGTRNEAGGEATVTAGRAQVPADAWGPRDSNGMRYAQAEISTEHPDFPGWSQPVVMTVRDRNGNFDIVGIMRPR